MLIEAKDNSTMADTSAQSSVPVINVHTPGSAANAGAQGFYGTGNQHANSTWVITGFIAFLIIIWGIWRSHSQASDMKHDLNNAINQSNLQAAVGAAKLGEIQNTMTLAQLATNQYRENDLRFGSTVSHNLIPVGRRGGMGGPIVNGGGITDTFQADNSVF